MTSNQTSLWALTAAGFFGVGFAIMVATNGTASEPVAYLMSLCFLAFHLALFPVVANLRAPTWAKGSGYAWLAVDNVLVVMSILGVSTDTVTPMRLGIHIAAATWILTASLQSSNMAVRNLGALTGVWLGGYSIVAPYVPATLFYPAGLLLLIWCATVGFTATKTTTSMESAAPTM